MNLRDVEVREPVGSVYPREGRLVARVMQHIVDKLSDCVSFNTVWEKGGGEERREEERRDER
jgi:hypothetical protein